MNNALATQTRQGSGRATSVPTAGPVSTIASHCVDVRPSRAHHVSHALCRYRRYRVYWAPRGVPSARQPARRRGVGSGPTLVATSLRGADRAKPRWGELTEPSLGLTDEAVAELGDVDHLVHCAAIYDITAAEPEQRAANVDGTRAVIDLARRLDATLHHVSSIAVAGDFHGEYTEADFDIGQQLPTPYHQTKFEAEMLARSTPGPRYRIY